MKKLPALLNTPAKAVSAVGLIILATEFLIMALFDVIHGAYPANDQLVVLFNYLDPILLIALASPALYLLIFKPMRSQQAELEAARKKIGQAYQEWMDALDVMSDPIFLHDQQFRILRCNKAYQQCAGLPFHEIIGQPYYEVFPKNHAPLPSCLRAMEKAEEEEEEVTVGATLYRLRVFSIKDAQGVFLYSMHLFEDITEHKRTEAVFQALVASAVANVGAAFFHEAAGSLCTWLGAECAIVGELVDGNRVRALAMQLDGKAVAHYEYALPGTPCERATQKGYCAYSEGVQQLFPEDKDLADMGAQAYVGIPLRDTDGKVNGILCVISRHKLVLPPMAPDMFEIMGARAGTEIGRLQAQAKLVEQLEELRRWHDATIGRETRVLDLKREVNELLGSAGQAPRYPSVEDDPQQK